MHQIKAIFMWNEMKRGVHNPPWSCTSLSADEVHDLVLTLTRNAGIRQEDLDEGQRMVTQTTHSNKSQQTQEHVLSARCEDNKQLRLLQ